MNYAEEIEKLKQQIADLEGKLGQEKQDRECAFKINRPAYGSVYFFLSGTGLIGEDCWSDHENHIARLVINNVFKSRQDAEKELERRKVITEWNSWAKYFNEKEGWVADWSDPRQFKIFPTFNHNTKDIERSSNLTMLEWPYEYVGLRESYDKIISKIGEDRMKLIWGVE